MEVNHIGSVIFDFMSSHEVILSVTGNLRIRTISAMIHLVSSKIVIRSQEIHDEKHVFLDFVLDLMSNLPSTFPYTIFPSMKQITSVFLSGCVPASRPIHIVLHWVQGNLMATTDFILITTTISMQRRKL